MSGVLFDHDQSVYEILKLIEVPLFSLLFTEVQLFTYIFLLKQHVLVFLRASLYSFARTLQSF